jgi:hypothetical protein
VPEWITKEPGVRAVLVPESAIAALSGGEAVATVVYDSYGLAKMVWNKDRGKGNQPPDGSILYTTPRIPDGKEPVAWREPTPYGMGYSFASEEVMRDLADWLTAAPGDEGDHFVDANKKGALAPQPKDGELLALCRLIVDEAMSATASGQTCFVPRYQLDKLRKLIGQPDSGEVG